MDLEGNLILDRKPAQRWVSALAVIVPVVACLAGVTWFVRAFISPPTIAIPGPMVLATAPAPPPVRPVREEPRVPEPAPPPAAAMQPAAPAPSAAAPTTPSYSFSLPMLATLAAAPPSTTPAAAAARPGAPTAFADPMRDGPAVMSTVIEAAAAPIAGPIPMPRPRPEVTAAVTGHAVPLPRSRPAEEEAASPALNAEPAYGRHSVD
jgi:hypothetical protein